jgi:hypothetical protein
VTPALVLSEELEVSINSGGQECPPQIGLGLSIVTCCATSLRQILRRVLS